jgi:hypothetical protein
VKTLIEIFNDPRFDFNIAVKDSDPDIDFFKFAASHPVTTADRIFLFDARVKLEYNYKHFHYLPLEQYKTLMDYLDEKGIKRKIDVPKTLSLGQIWTGAIDITDDDNTLQRKLHKKK